MRSNAKQNKKRPSKKPTSKSQTSEELTETTKEEQIFGDSVLLKYDIDEKGIGQIRLPPSLSTLLQSDRVTISPSAGGLFIRSV